MKKNKDYDQILIKVHKEGTVSDSEFDTWRRAYNTYADYLNSNIEMWNYEHEKHYSDVPYSDFIRSKVSELLAVLHWETGMSFKLTDEFNFIGTTKSGNGKIFF